MVRCYSGRSPDETENWGKVVRTVIRAGLATTFCNFVPRITRPEVSLPRCVKWRSKEPPLGLSRSFGCRLHVGNGWAIYESRDLRYESQDARPPANGLRHRSCRRSPNRNRAEAFAIPLRAGCSGYSPAAVMLTSSDRTHYHIAATLDAGVAAALALPAPVALREGTRLSGNVITCMGKRPES